MAKKITRRDLLAGAGAAGAAGSLKPDALFIPRILLTPGNWWCKDYPEDITMRDDGSPAGMF